MSSNDSDITFFASFANSLAGLNNIKKLQSMNEFQVMNINNNKDNAKLKTYKRGSKNKETEKGKEKEKEKEKRKRKRKRKRKGKGKRKRKRKRIN